MSASYARWPRCRHSSRSLRLGPAVPPSMSSVHLHDELAQTHDRVVVKTRFGPVTGGRSRNGAAVFLGKGTYSPLGFALDQIGMIRNTLCSSTSKIRESSSSPFGVSLPAQRLHHREFLSVQIVPYTLILVDTGVDFWLDAVQPSNDGQAAGMYG